MNRLAAFFLISVVFVQAQDGSSAFSETPPDASSPFFTSGGVRAEELQATELRDSPSKSYPRVKQSPEPAWEQIRSFFTKFVPPLHFGKSQSASAEASLTVVPQNPQLKDQRELEVTYAVRNNSKEMTRLEFPTSQHIEILTRKASGSVVDRWSDDRGFQKEEGIVVINPRERIEYQEKISTREMRTGESYTVEAALKTQPDHAVSQAVNPR
jgi:hypothetical protein